ATRARGRDNVCEPWEPGTLMDHRGQTDTIPSFDAEDVDSSIPLARHPILPPLQAGQARCAHCGDGVSNDGDHPRVAFGIPWHTKCKGRRCASTAPRLTACRCLNSPFHPYRHLASVDAPPPSLVARRPSPRW